MAENNITMLNNFPSIKKSESESESHSVVSDSL